MGGDTYAYDSEGNMVTRTNAGTGVITTYDYDHRNRLVRLTERIGSVVMQTLEFAYDANDRRLSESINGSTFTFAYDRDDAWADLGVGGAIAARYLQGDRIDDLQAAHRATSGTNWYLTDHIGSVRGVVNSSGSVVARIGYDGFGRVVSESGQSLGDRFRFTGREKVSTTGLYFYRARFYDPVLGRFLSSDPIGFAGDDYNLYRYAANNPISLTDPTGRSTIIEYKIIVGGRGYGIALHGGHHSWRFLGRQLFCIHIQILYYLQGVTGSGFRIQIPLPWCRGTRFPRF